MAILPFSRRRDALGLRRTNRRGQAWRRGPCGVESLEDRRLLAAIEPSMFALAESPVEGQLRKLYDDWSAQQIAAQQGGSQSGALGADNDLLQILGDSIYIEVIAAGDPHQLAGDLQAIGLTHTSVSLGGVSALAPFASLPALHQLPGVHYAYASLRPLFMAGAAETQGDVAMRTDDVRNLLGFDGTGVTVGVISDSYNVLGGAPADVASGDLPPGVNVLLDSGAGPFLRDEGRAMLQVIHDVAPGASLAFRAVGREFTAQPGDPPMATFGNELDFAAAVNALVGVGADVIVDDAYFMRAPFFQDGFGAQAVNSAFGAGVTYVAAAGNSGDLSYEANYLPSGQSATVGDASGEFHTFDGTSNLRSLFQRVSVPAGTSFAVSHQAAYQYRSLGGATPLPAEFDFIVVDYDLLEANGGFNDLASLQTALGVPGVVRANGSANGLTDDPVEVVTVAASGSPTNLAIAIFRGQTTVADPRPLIKHVIVPTSQTSPTSVGIQFATSGQSAFPSAAGTIFGHANAAGAITVGAANFDRTPLFGMAPPELASYSSRGGTPILFPTPEARSKPLIVGPDGGNTTFFGTDIGGPHDPDSQPNFFGTSAAAAHVAAVAALMLNADSGLAPTQIATLLANRAIDIVSIHNRGSGVTTTIPGGGVGFDAYSGFGFVDGYASVQDAVGIPTVDLNGPAPGINYTATFTEGGGPQLIVDPLNLTVDDPNPLETLVSATVTLTNPLDGALETLTVDVGATGLVANYAAGVLSITGNGSLGAYQQVLRTLRYNNTSLNPNGANRIVTVSVRDDDNNDSPNATITVLMDLVNDPPTALDDSYSVDEGATLTVNAPGVLLNDSDPENDPLTVDTTPVVAPAHGILTLNANGSFTYVHNGSETTSDSFVYRVRDPGDLTATATVTITINPVNDPPVANPQDISTNEDTPFNGMLTSTDVDGGPPTYSIVTNVPGSAGIVVINNASTGAFTYTPALDFNGSTSFTFRVFDGFDFSNTATVSITVDPVNDPPSVSFAPNPLTVLEDAGPQTFPGYATFSPGGGPDEAGQTAIAYNITNNTNPGLFSAGPSIALNGTLTFTTAPNAFGSAIITVTVQDSGGMANGGQDTSAPTTFTINVTGVNDPPSVSFAPNPVTVLEDAGPQSFPGYATFSPGPANEAGQTAIAYNITNNTNPGLFSAGPSIALNGTLTFTTAPNAFGSAIITVTVQDSGGTANSGQDTSAPTNFTINVTAVNDPPVGNDDAYGVQKTDVLTVPPRGVLQNDTDVDDDPLTLAVSAVNGVPANVGVQIATGKGALLTLNANGSFSYDPTGVPAFQALGAGQSDTDTFTYTVRDPSGATDTALVTITISGLNQPPIARPNAYTVSEDAAVSGNVITDPPADSDPDMDPLSVSAVNGVAGNVGMLITLASGATLQVNANGTFTYNAAASATFQTLAPGQTETETFTYTITDGLAFDSALVTMTITGVNDAPVANPDSYTLDEGGTLSVPAPGLLENDTDVDDGQTLTVLTTPVTPPAHGMLTLNANGSFTYVHNGSETTSDSFVYRITDGAGGFANATVTLTINPVNDPPVFTSTPVTTAVENSLYSYSITTFDPDIGDSRTITAPTLPSWLALVDNGNGTAVLSGTPATIHIGLHPVVLRVQDVEGAFALQSFTIEVLPDNVPPTANDDVFTGIPEDSIAFPLDVLANDTTFPDVGETLTITGVSAVPLGHTVTISGAPGSQVLLYTPPANFFGTISFVYRINDGSAPDSTDTATVTVTVDPVNDPPTANDDTFFGVPEDAIDFPLDVLANDTIFPDVGETLTITGVSGVEPGHTVTISGAPGSQVLLYSPPTGFRGTTQFQYTIDDGNGGTDTANVNIAVFNVPVFQIPATGDLYAIGSDGPDRIVFYAANFPNGVLVRYNDRVFGPFLLQPTSRLYAEGRGGNDQITVANVDFDAVFDGGEGSDYLAGGSGDDTLIGGDGNDRILGGSGNNVMYGDDGNDRIEGRDGDDTIYGGEGNDVLSGRGGDDWIDGGPGNDQISGGDGDDILRGGGGNDVISGDQGNDIVIGGDGDDRLFGRDGDDILIGGEGLDRLQGDAGSDLLLGGFSVYDEPTPANDAALRAILAEWASGAALSARIANLLSGANTGGNTFAPGSTALDDFTDLDDLTGGLGEDWFIAFGDRVRDDRLEDEVYR